VLFLDIVEYSRKPVAEQLLIKERMNHHVSKAIHDIALADRIILDTGDGVAINFLGDPEDALVVALRLTDAFAREPGQASPIQVRSGINLGPVRLARDINSQPNIIGDGINVAQRVMSFAQPGQVLVSRSYHEVITRISDEYERLFAYQGSRTDKHVREHEIYQLEPVNAAVRQMVEKRRQARRRREPGARATHAFGIFSHRGLALGALAGSTLAFVGALLLMLQTEPPPAPPPAKRAAPAQPAPLAAPSSTLAMVPALGGGTTSAPQSTHPQAAPPAQKSAPRAASKQERPTPLAGAKNADAPALPAAAEAAPDEPAPKAAEAAAPPAPAEPAPAHPAASTALVVLAISPWGEVYVNGKRMGVSPPLTELELPKGKHRIEVRNGAFKPFEEDYELGSNETVRIKHKFTQRR
jgi:class 3 adenylate cyclase